MRRLFGPALKLDWRIAVLKVVSTTRLVINAYHTFTPLIYVDRVILYLVIPLWLQAVPFVIAHIGKPEVETLSTIFGGFAFGWVAWRTRSFVYPFLIHWYIATFTILVAGGALG
jgi:membrane protease YdiL (CAAX protease family)